LRFSSRQSITTTNVASVVAKNDGSFSYRLTLNYVFMFRFFRSRNSPSRRGTRLFLLALASFSFKEFFVTQQRKLIELQIIAGEDGCIKIWSRIGMLRTKLVVNAEPVLSADWNSDSSKIVYTQHDTICIKSLKANIKTIKVNNISIYISVYNGQPCSVGDLTTIF